MKKSRIFMTIAAFALATTGALALKESPKFANYYYFNKSTSACSTSTVSLPSICTTPGSNPCLYEGNASFPIYEQSGSTNCATPVLYN